MCGLVRLTTTSGGKLIKSILILRFISSSLIFSVFLSIYSLSEVLFISVAGVIELSASALLALDLAAPHELAVTLLMLNNNLQQNKH